MGALAVATNAGGRSLSRRVSHKFANPVLMGFANLGEHGDIRGVSRAHLRPLGRVGGKTNTRHRLAVAPIRGRWEPLGLGLPRSA